jgi:hypothetical protein
MIDKKLQKYYEDRFSTMSTQGWKDLMDDVEAMLVSTNSLEGVDSVEKLHFRKGELSILMWLKSIRSISEQAYEELNNASNQ